MGYRDDFYIVANIVGYTGNIAQSPTVYFRGGNEYGRITQKHDITTNLGRNTVHNDPTYQFQNQLQPNGALCMVEMSQGQVVHTSRNQFVPAAGLGPGNMALLAQAIVTFPHEKTVSEYDDDLFDVLDRKDAVNAQLLAGRPALRSVAQRG